MLALGNGYLAVEKCPCEFTDDRRGSIDSGHCYKVVMRTLRLHKHFRLPKPKRS